MRNSSLEVLEGRIGYHFKDKYLLECALTHTSFANEQKIHRYKDYERLEFLVTKGWSSSEMLFLRWSPALFCIMNTPIKERES